MVLQKLADAHLNIDRVWGLLFVPPEDPRDERPLLYPGRIAFPMTNDFKFKDWAWRNSSLFKKSAQVGPVKFQKTTNMLYVDDVASDALPPTSDPATHMSPPEKHQQIGVEAALAVVRAAAD
eukprot:4034962-Karenia_brevis.AAC.1